MNNKNSTNIWKKFKNTPLDNPVKTMVITIAICLVASFGVTYTALTLQPLQKLNELNEKRINILKVAGIYNKNINIDKIFEQIDTKIVDVRTGRFTNDVDTDFNATKALKNKNLYRNLTKNQDIASIRKQSYYQVVYLLKDKNTKKNIAKYEAVILPIKGYGLWSTLYGFISIATDGNTIKGLRFYSHKETPGLGGEVDNPLWLVKWPNKKIHDKNGNIAISVVKGKAQGPNQVDALAGATLTSNGVNNLVRFWVGKNGFESFLQFVSKGGLE